MKRWIMLAALVFPLALAGCSDHYSNAYAPPPPPPIANNAAQLGYHDGFEAARRDVTRQMPPDLRRHPKFRHPPVPRPAIGDYRSAFSAGYDAFIHHGPPPQYR